MEGQEGFIGQDFEGVSAVLKNIFTNGTAKINESACAAAVHDKFSKVTVDDAHLAYEKRLEEVRLEEERCEADNPYTKKSRKLRPLGRR